MTRTSQTRADGSSDQRAIVAEELAVPPAGAGTAPGGQGQPAPSSGGPPGERWRQRSRIDDDRLAAFCRRWKVRELALFGSVLRDDFTPDSDVDVLVSFAEGAEWSLFDWVSMREELEHLFNRRVDLVERSALRNPFRRHAILGSHKVIYAA